jgi:serine/threonine protein kinase
MEGIISKHSFEMISVLGKGAYGKVVLVKKRIGSDSGHHYAMKILKKSEILKLN